MIVSSGSLTSTTLVDRILWSGTASGTPEWLAYAFASYDRIYERQPWIATLVDKISVSHSRLPYKTYVKEANGRKDSDGKFAELMAKPCPVLSNFDLFRWTTATLNINGSAVWVKTRDSGGRPISVHPRHPSRIKYDSVDGGWWLIDRFGQKETRILRRDFVHFRMFNPRSFECGLSPLEPLRSALENETGAQKANSAMWLNGAKPSVFLEHPKTLSPGVTERLASSWDNVHGGVDNWSKAAVLEEGMVARVLPISYEDLAYVESRKLNRDECCSRYDIPPPVVHILDRATFSNITEQMRSMYRDSMGWRVNQIESTIDAELRDGSFGEGEPDFGGREYGKFLMDEVLRGAFEARQDALQKADHMTIAEKRELEELPFIPGTDRIFLNSATLPLNEDGELAKPVDAAAVVSVSGNQSVRTVMGRLGRVNAVTDVDAAHLASDVDDATRNALIGVLAETEATDMDTLRAEIGAALNGGTPNET